MQIHNNTVAAVKPCRVCHSHMRVKEIPSLVYEEDTAWQFLYCDRCGFGPNYSPMLMGDSNNLYSVS